MPRMISDRALQYSANFKLLIYNLPIIFSISYLWFPGEPLSPSSSYTRGSAASCSRSSSEYQHLNSSRDEEAILEEDDRASTHTLQEIESLQPNSSHSLESQAEEVKADNGLSEQQLEKLPVIKQPVGCNRGYGTCQNNGGRNILSSSSSSDSSLARQCAYLSYSAPAGLNHVSILSSPAEFNNSSEVTISSEETKDAQVNLRL